MKNAFILMLFTGLMWVAGMHSYGDSQLSKKPTPTEQLSADLRRIHGTSHIPGFAISVVIDNKLVYQQAFGKRDIANSRTYTNNTTQPIASISKTFIAAAMAKAMEQGLFDLETDINQILPFRIVNPKAPEHVIRVKHLVTHTSGLIDNEEIYMHTYHILPGEDLTTPGSKAMMSQGILPGAGMELGELISQYYLQGGSLYSLDNFAEVAPGKIANYSNMASSLAAYLIQTKTGQHFADYVKQYILTPLGMTSTAYSPENLDPDNAALLYVNKTTSLPAYRFDSYPDGGLHTSNEDFAKFLLDMMKGQAGESSVLFSQKSYQLLFKPLHQIDESTSTGVFWYVSPTYIAHDGGDPGVSTRLVFDREQNQGHLFISNIDSSAEGNQEQHQAVISHIDNAISRFMETYSK